MKTIDRYLGSMLGLAAGDALGTTLEFSKPGNFEPITDMVGGGPFKLPAGCWTDDTSMALCLAESIIEKGWDPVDQMYRYCMWVENGHLSSIGQCFDIGHATFTALVEFRQVKSEIEPIDPFCGSEDPKSSGNGSLMRLTPVVLRYHSDPKFITNVIESSKTTHASQECIDACVFYSLLIKDALLGKSKEDILRTDRELDLSEKIKAISSGSYKVKNPPDICGKGYVVLSLEAALWAFYNSTSFEEGCLKAANLGEDADTTAAIYGQLAGAYYGFDSIPQSWRDKLALKEKIEEYATKIYELTYNN